MVAICSLLLGCTLVHQQVKPVDELKPWDFDLGIAQYGKTVAFWDKYDKPFTVKVNFKDKSYARLASTWKKDIGNNRNNPKPLNKLAKSYKENPSRDGLTKFLVSFLHVLDPTETKGSYYATATMDMFTFPSLYAEMRRQYTGELNTLEANLLCSFCSRLNLAKSSVVTLFDVLRKKQALSESTARSFYHFAMAKYRVDGLYANRISSIISEAEQLRKELPQSPYNEIFSGRIEMTKAIQKKDKNAYCAAAKKIQTQLELIASTSSDPYDKVGAKRGANEIKYGIKTVDKFFAIRFK